MFNSRRRKRFVRRLTYFAPRWHWAYRMCKMYVDNYRGDNNADLTINGEVRFLHSYLTDKGKCVVFDVGANHGQWCRQVLHAQPLAQIHCFEPSTRAYQTLIASNFPPNVVCNNVGIGSQPEERVFYVNEGFSELSSFHINDPSRALKPEVVRIETLLVTAIRWRITQIDFLKIDVEGHELEVLKAQFHTWRPCRDAIQFEYGSTYIGSRTLLKDVFNRCRTDYEFYKILPFSVRSIPRYETHLETFETSNYLLLRRASS